MKIIAIGRNYVAHAKELNNVVPKKPLIFMKPDSAILDKGNPFYYPEFSKDIHYELELVIKIKKPGKYINGRFSHQYYDEIGLGIDLTARDLQADLKAKGHPWEIAKGFDKSAVIGKFIPKKQFPDLQNLQIKLHKNDQIVQNGNTQNMIFKIDYLISYVSQFFTLKIGDLIFTGTPEGVGPIAIGDNFEGFLENQKLLACKIL